MNSRPKVLLIAEACNPSWVSVPLEGWSSSQALSRVADTHLVTHIRNRPALLAAGLREESDFTAIDSDRVAAPLNWLASKLRGGKGRGWTTVTAFRSLAYYYFEHLVWKRFGLAIAKGRFDLVHRLTPISPTAASLLAKRCAREGVPFILGPLNGGLHWPREFAGARRREGEWLSWVRGMHRWLPGYHATRKHAAAIVVGSVATAQQVEPQYQSKCIYVPENAIEPQRFAPVERVNSKVVHRPIRVAFIGRLVDYKNPDVIIEAIAPLAREGSVQLDLFGDGPLKESLAALITQLRLQEHVRLHGWTAHEKLAAHLATSDLFAFPSIREFGGAVVVEAMAMGVVPIVVNYGGPAELVSNDSGFCIPLTARDGLISSLHNVVADVVAHPGKLAAMREAGMQRVRQWFTWESKANQLLQVYRWVLGQRATKPDFGMPLGSRNDRSFEMDAHAPAQHEPHSQTVLYATTNAKW